MAASRFTLNNPDLVDVGAVMEAFEQINNVVITLTGRVVHADGKGSLHWEIQAHSRDQEIGDLPSLASVRFYPGHPNHRTMEAATMWALYQLDGILAAAEMGKTDHGA